MKKVKLGEVLSLKKGKKATVLAEQTTLSQRYIQIDDLRNNNNLKFTESLNMTEALPDDILIAWDGANAGTIGYGLSGAVGSTITVLKKNERYKEKIISDYLGVFLESKSQYLRDHSTGATIPHLNKNILLDLQLELLGIEEQENIISILNTIKRLITKRKLQLDELNLLVKSRFNEMFGDPVLNEMGWDKHALKEFGIWKSGGTPKRNEEEFFRGNIPWITSGELEHKYIEDSFEKITEKAIECSSAKIIEKGSLLLGMYDTAGLKSSINTKVISCNQAIAFAKLDDKITNTIYVYYVIQNLRSTLLNQQRGVRQKNFNLSMIKNISIPLPPLALQNEFADFVAQVDKSKFLQIRVPLPPLSLQNEFADFVAQVDKSGFAFKR